MRQGWGRWLFVGGLVLGVSACQPRDGAVSESGVVPRLAVFQAGAAVPTEEGTGGSGSGSLGSVVAEDVPDFYGTVTISGARGFTVRDDDGVERPFVVAPSTRILRDGKRVARTQLSPGVLVHTTYGERLGSWVATDVEIYSGTPSRDMTATAAAAPVKR
ncbi:hypothetical protein HI113_06080 [Corallococcus exiguus]|uniref:hypothetical protein n=1 Tax=Corallococcus TaxID=83461 RepID=UPI000EC7FBAB|nr:MULTISPECIES: hypothetical protein [Corallococcus]NNB93476.1 hypothetical protein [Corallococcus exiguus]NPC48153.1 hypothetical protein [Corallococcus exiguus]RKH78586.1 hypothetical protein D7X99_27515 [Corallococcus sp. AB032C]